MKEIEELIDRCVLLTEKLEGLLEEHPVASGSVVYQTAVRVLTMQVNQLQQDVITKQRAESSTKGISFNRSSVECFTNLAERMISVLAPRNGACLICGAATAIPGSAPHQPCRLPGSR